MGEGASERVTYLHGDLDLRIIEARYLPNMDLLTEHLRRCFTGCDSCYRPPPQDPSSVADTDAEGDRGKGDEDKKIRHHRRIITSDPYVTVCVPQATLARTRVIPNAQNPKWDERFCIPMAHPLVDLVFHVKDNDLFGAQLIGKALIPAEKIAAGGFISGSFLVVGANSELPKPDSALRIEMELMLCDKNPLCNDGYPQTECLYKRGFKIQVVWSFGQFGRSYSILLFFRKKITGEYLTKGLI